jgi:predicted nucleic acid-binding protein
MDIRSFLADTNIISETYKPKPHPVIKSWFLKQPELVLCYPVILEIEMGIASRSRHDPAGGDRLRRWLDRLLDTSGNALLEMTVSAAQLQARMMEVPALRGLWKIPNSKRLRPPGQDLAIAALSIEHQRPIATVNTRDFMLINEYFPLPGVFDPSVQLWNVARKPKSRRRRGVPVQTSMELVQA